MPPAFKGREFTSAKHMQGAHSPWQVLAAGLTFAFMENSLRIIYMGTPDFAVPPLQKLVEAGCQVVAVITSPDRPAGRGLKLQASPVKQYATEAGIPVLQPEKLKNPDFLAELESYRADLGIVVAFRMLPLAVWDMPRLGTFNLHASLLPQYRGAAPINRAIMNGETESGLTTFFLKHQIDTGDILLQERMPIGEDENAGELHDRMSLQGAALVLKTVRMIEAGNTAGTPQDTSMPLKEAPKIFKEDCRIHWEADTREVHNLIRGLSPYPAAWTLLDGKVFKVYRSQPIMEAGPTVPGQVITDHKTYLHISTGNGQIALLEIQLEGKKKMTTEEFLRGYKLTAGSLG